MPRTHTVSETGSNRDKAQRAKTRRPDAAPNAEAAGSTPPRGPRAKRQRSTERAEAPASTSAIPAERPSAAGEPAMTDRRISSPRTTMLLTFKEAMQFLRVSRSTIYRLMWSGQLRGHKVGSTWRFYEADLLAAVAAPEMEPAEARAARVGGGQD